MSTSYTIGQLARLAGVAVSTIRYYERRRLLSADFRSSANYRLYGEGALERLGFVRSAQAAGFTLSDIQGLLEFRDGDMEVCGKVRSLLNQRLKQVRQQQAHLQQVDSLLSGWLRSCQAADQSDRCRVLERLAEASLRRQPRFSQNRS